MGPLSLLDYWSDDGAILVTLRKVKVKSYEEQPLLSKLCARLFSMLQKDVAERRWARWVDCDGEFD